MNMSIQKKFGYCIRIFRQNLGLSQEEWIELIMHP